MSELEQPISFEELCLKLHALFLRPASQQLALHVSPQPPRYPFGYLELVNCSNAEGPSSELTEVTAQRSTLDSLRHHQARQAALCRIIIDERASLEQVQIALQSAVIGYRVAVRKGALLQHILNGLQPRFAALRGEKDMAEQIAAGLATQVQNLQGDLQAVQEQHDGMTGLVHTLQAQNTALSGTVENLQEYQGRLTRRAQQLEDQNVTLGEEAVSLQERLDATVHQQYQDVATIERLQMEKEALRCKVADQEQQMAAQAQKLEAQEQRMREQGDAVKGQEQQVVNLEQQVDDLLSKLKDEQQGEAAAVMEYEGRIAVLGVRLEEEQEGKAAAAEANKAVVQGLQGQLAEQRTQFGAESTAQNAQVEGLQQSLAAKTQQHDKLAADHSNALQAHKAELHSSTLQVAELQSVVESKQAEIGELGHRLTASQLEVEALRQEKGSAVQARSAASQEYEGRIAALSARLEEEQKGKAAAAEEYEAQRLSQQDSAAVGQQERIDDPTQRLSDTACEASGLHHQGASSRVVDEEVDAPQLHNSEDLLSSELASSEQRQGPPKLDLYREEGRYKPPYMWPGYSPSPAATVEQNYSDGAKESEANRGSGSHQLSSRLDRDMRLFTGPVSSSQGDQKHSYSHVEHQHGHRFAYDRVYEYPARRRGDLNPAHPSVQQQHGTFGYDDGMRPPGFPAAPKSNEWGPEPSSSGAASEQHDDGMRPPGFPANPNRGMAAAQSGRQLQLEPSSSAAQRMQQQRQNGQRGRHKRGPQVGRRQ